MQRPGITRALERLESGDAGALVVARLDRLSRSVRDFAELVDLSRAQGWSLVCLDLGLDTATATGAAMAQMLSVFAELERRLIGERISEALRAKRRNGKRLGRPSTLGAEVVEQIRSAREEGTSYAKIADALNKAGTPTGQGGAKWYPSSVRAVLRSQRT